MCHKPSLSFDPPSTGPDKEGTPLPLESLYARFHCFLHNGPGLKPTRWGLWIRTQSSRCHGDWVCPKRDEVPTSLSSRCTLALDIACLNSCFPCPFSLRDPSLDCLPRAQGNSPSRCIKNLYSARGSNQQFYNIL